MSAISIDGRRRSRAATTPTRNSADVEVAGQERTDYRYSLISNSRYQASSCGARGRHARGRGPLNLWLMSDRPRHRLRHLMEQALTTYGGRVKPEDVRSLVTTAKSSGGSRRRKVAAERGGASVARLPLCSFRRIKNANWQDQRTSNSLRRLSGVSQLVRINPLS
jgi:hypothetical protein